MYVKGTFIKRFIQRLGEALYSCVEKHKMSIQNRIWLQTVHC